MLGDYHLLRVFKQPQASQNLSLKDWNDLIPQARHSLLSGQLHELLEQADLAQSLPQQPLNHSLSAALASKKQQATARWEIDKIMQALESIEVPVLVLKGAAYVIADLPVAKGRLMSDVDLLAPKADIERVEGALRAHGWAAGKVDPYDERYYRQWMHEIPPLQHMTRRSVIDLHHTILPPTARYKPDAQKLINAAVEIKPGLKVLCPEDMVIHSATHLFHDGELEHGLRDLVDIDGLLKYFSTKDPEFWGRLVPRAIDLDLINPLYYGLHYAHIILSTPIPEQVLKAAEVGRPKGILSPILDSLFLRALRPDHPSCDISGTAFARFVLYVRSHYLRMPLRLLIPHLLRKAWKRRFAQEEKKEEPLKAPVNQNQQAANN